MKRKDVDVEEKIHGGVFGIHCYPIWGQREVWKISHLGFLGFDFKHNPKVHLEGKMAKFYNLGLMF